MFQYAQGVPVTARGWCVFAALPQVTTDGIGIETTAIANHKYKSAREDITCSDRVFDKTAAVAAIS